MTKGFELLRTQVITGKFRFDLINVNQRFNWTGLNVLYNSLEGYNRQDQVFLTFPTLILLRMRDSYTNPYETKRIKSFEIFGLTNRIHETGI
jgi:hypothetical protein